MTYSVVDYDPVWGMGSKPVKIWATSKIAFNRYIDDIKIRYNNLCGYNIKNIHLSDIDHIEIVRDQVDYYFKEKVWISDGIGAGQFIIEGYPFYDFLGKRISAHYLKRKNNIENKL
ncbi:hypothetical protein LQZ19_17325 [Treponema primitia]|uniref:hypothetical protein n=1 Tax=Treponema primitia TaxID=88058 RepID=UPI00397FB069